jgi:hypothetical protein
VPQPQLQSLQTRIHALWQQAGFKAELLPAFEVAMAPRPQQAAAKEQQQLPAVLLQAVAVGDQREPMLHWTALAAAATVMECWHAMHSAGLVVPAAAGGAAAAAAVGTASAAVLIVQRQVKGDKHSLSQLLQDWCGVIKSQLDLALHPAPRPSLLVPRVSLNAAPAAAAPAGGSSSSSASSGQPLEKNRLDTTSHLLPLLQQVTSASASVGVSSPWDAHVQQILQPLEHVRTVLAHLQMQHLLHSGSTAASTGASTALLIGSLR